MRYLTEPVGITEIHAQQRPEEKLAVVRQETAKAKALYAGDGINVAPAMMAATVGMATGQNRDVTTAAAGLVVTDHSLKKVDEFMHISRWMRLIALQSTGGGMTVRQNVAVGLAHLPLDAAERKKRVRQVIEAVGSGLQRMRIRRNCLRRHKTARRTGPRPGRRAGASLYGRTVQRPGCTHERDAAR